MRRLNIHRENIIECLRLQIARQRWFYHSPNEYKPHAHGLRILNIRMRRERKQWAYRFPERSGLPRFRQLLRRP